MAVGPAGLPGHRALGVEGPEVAPARIPLLGMEDKPVLGNRLRCLTVRTKSCNT